MKNSLFSITGFLLCLVASLSFQETQAQQAPNYPFDSIAVTNITATTGNVKGSVNVSLTFKNSYSRIARLHLILGGFEGLGITDDLQVRYKIFTNDQMVSTEGINQGFSPIDAVWFGSKKQSGFTYLDQVLNAGSSQVLTVTLKNVGDKVSTLKEFHVKAVLYINNMRKGETVIKLSNIPVQKRKG